MENNTLIVTNLDRVVEQLTTCVMDIIKKDRQQDAQLRKAEIEPVYYTRQEAADRLHISLAALHNRINKGDLPAYHIGGRTLFKAEDLNKSLIRKKL